MPGLKDPMNPYAASLQGMQGGSAFSSMSPAAEELKKRRKMLAEMQASQIGSPRKTIMPVKKAPIGQNKMTTMPVAPSQPLQY
jgi:hypothetical protein